MADEYGRWTALARAVKGKVPGLIFVGGVVGTPVLLGPITAVVIVLGMIALAAIWCSPEDRRAAVAERLFLASIPWAHQRKGSRTKGGRLKRKGKPGEE